MRGAFTGAQRDRPGLLRPTDGGLLFAAVTRMTTLAPGGRITPEVLAGEWVRLRAVWQGTGGLGGPGGPGGGAALLDDALGAEAASALNLFDRAQLACVIRVCRGSRTLSWKRLVRNAQKITDQRAGT